MPLVVVSEVVSVSVICGPVLGFADMMHRLEFGPLGFTMSPTAIAAGSNI